MCFLSILVPVLSLTNLYGCDSGTTSEGKKHDALECNKVTFWALYAIMCVKHDVAYLHNGLFRYTFAWVTHLIGFFMRVKLVRVSFPDGARIRP